MRKHFVVEKKLQARMAMELLVILVAVPFLAWLDIFLLGFFVFNDQDAWLSSDKSVWGITATVLGTRWLFVAVLYVFNIAVIYFILLYYSHRIAAPVVKVNQCLKQLAEGNLDQSFKLRKRDFFRDLEGGFNAVAARFNDTITELLKASDTLRKNANHIDKPMLLVQLDAIDAVLNQYRVRARETDDGKG